MLNPHLTVRFVFILILAGLVTGTASADTMEKHAGMDMFGNDYLSEQPIASANPDECAQMCLADSRCRAATFMVPNGRYGSIARCWLKDAVPALTPDPLCTSWVKVADAPPGGSCWGLSPVADFSATPTTGSAPLSVQFTGPDANLWEWSFGDGSTSAIKNPSHTYSAPGSYSVTLKVTGHMNGGSCDPTPTDTKTRAGYITVTDSGTLSVTSNPAGATVSVDGKAQGNTPLAGIQLGAGTHTVTVLLPGYEDYYREVTISRNAQVQLQVALSKRVGPTPSAGSIQVTTNPPGASVAVDGLKKGTAPVTIPDLSSGQHSVSITKPGYADYVTKITVAGGQTTPLSVTLVQLSSTNAKPSVTSTPEDFPLPTAPQESGFGTLEIHSNPEGAFITLDGDEIGKTPTVVRNVETGKHIVVMNLEGFDANSQEHAVYQGVTTEVNHDFAKGKKTPGFGSGLAAIAVGLACLILLSRR